MEDTNKDLKILEEIKDMFVHLKNYGYINDIKKDIDTNKAIKAIESTINGYKELEEENEELKQRLHRVCKEANKVEWETHSMIPVSLVEEKIEELNKLITEAQKELGSASKEYTIYVYQKDILQELLKKRK